MRHRLVRLGVTVAILTTGATVASAAPDCRTISDPAARLACYDAAAGGTAAMPPASAGVPVRPQMPAPRTRARSAQRSVAARGVAPASPDLKHRAAFDATVASVTPLLHGYARITLDDGSAYETTQLVRPPRPGQRVHYRRTLVGTMYLDVPDRSPITVRLARDQEG